MKKSLLLILITLTALFIFGSASAQMMDSQGQRMESYEQPDPSSQSSRNDSGMYHGRYGGHKKMMPGSRMGMMGCGCEPCMMGGSCSGRGMMHGWGASPCMGGHGMAPGMMGCGMMGCGMNSPCGPGQGGCGWRSGPGMMDGYGKGPGMSGWDREPGMFGEMSSDEYRNFLDQTRDQRRKLHELRFEYREALRNPEADTQQINTLEQQMFELQQQIRTQARR